MRLASKRNGILLIWVTKITIHVSKLVTGGYISSFDGLRGFAVLLVLINHGSYGFFPGGFLGVDLFFIISGYLITSLLWTEYTTSADISLRNFYARRILRLYPALLIAVLLALSLWQHTLTSEGGSKLIASFASFFYLANVVDEKVMGNMNPFWSLSVEEHFYLVWPLFILLAAAKLSESKRNILILILIAGVTVFRLLAGAHEGQWRYNIFYLDAYSFTLCRIDCILIGALLYFMAPQQKLRVVNAHEMVDKIVLCAALIFILSCGFVMHISDSWLKGGFLITNAASALIVFETLRNPENFLFNNKALVWIGKRSYGIYLYHLPIYLALERLRIPHNNVNFLLVSVVRILLSVAVAALSYKFLEQPILQYKKKFQVALSPSHD
jgi:peptidoglycan/LPS O-acetylase OafA/YrhL